VSGPGGRGGGRGRARSTRRPKLREADPAAPPAERIAVRTVLAEAEVIPEAGRPWRRLLRLDGEDASHVDLRDPTWLEFAYVRRLADLADLLAPARAPLAVLHLGGGACTLARYVQATRPGSRQEVAEPDGALLELARAHLGLRTSPDLRVRVLDGREVLERRPSGSADLVVLDAFVGTDVPEQLADAGAVAAARRALRPGGVLAANVVDVPPLAAARGLGARMAAAFPHLTVTATRKVVRGRQGGNVVLAGSDGPLPRDALRARALRGPVPELVLGGDEARAWLAGDGGAGAG
jgi:spermidine synthase